jgi:hypothetical protein
MGRGSTTALVHLSVKFTRIYYGAQGIKHTVLVSVLVLVEISSKIACTKLCPEIVARAGEP